MLYANPGRGVAPVGTPTNNTADAPAGWASETALDGAGVVDGTDAIAAEQAGFDSIDVSDHFAPWSEAGQSCFAWTWLGAVAARTSRIHLGSGVTCPTLRYHSAVVAQAVATVEYLAPGRVYLGVGTGEALNEYAATGMWPGYKERQERLAEART